MNPNPKSAGLSVRIVSTFLILLSCIALLVTGIVLYFHPSWSRLPGLYREFWTDWHIALALIFLISAGIHLGYNFKTLLRYLGKAPNRAMTQKRELFVALALFGIVMAAVGMGLLPFDSLKGSKGEGHKPVAKIGIAAPTDED